MFGKNRNKKVGLCLMVVTSCFILAALWAVLATPETALAHKYPEDPEHSHGKGGEDDGGGPIPVTVTFRDFLGTENPPLPADGVQSDGKGPYTRERGSKVKAYIGKCGQLLLQTWDSTVRSILLNIPDISDPACPDTPQGGFGHANLITLGEDDDGDGILTEGQLDTGITGDRLDLLAMDPGDENSTKAGLRITFPVPDNKNGVHLYVRFGGGEEDLVTVTRVSDSVWTIEAGAGDDAAKAAVIHVASKCTAGYVSMPFRITVEILP